jgi:membrane-associated phospholipid phosphatase
VNPLSRGTRIWLTWLLACVVVVAAAFPHLDVAVARFVLPWSGHLSGLAAGLGGAVILTMEAAAFLALALLRIVRGHISPFGKAVALACLSSICAYAVNASVLKVFFGVEPPFEVLHDGARHAFHLLEGSPNSSFPSGHMALAGAFAGVFMRLYRSSIKPLAALLAVAAATLVVGNWHFVSDVAAGTFIGISAGVLAGEIWMIHEGWETPP